MPSGHSAGHSSGPSIFSREFWRGDPDKRPRVPEPYGGQKCCPVTGEKLGSHGPALPVDTMIGSKKPSLVGRWFGRKPSKGVTVYVCCQTCAAKVRSDPSPYLLKVIAERSGWEK